MRPTISDVFPMNVNGETIYVETRLRGLGAANTAALTTVTNVTNVVNAANAAIPQGKVTVQSDFSKVANIVATGASVVAAVGVVFPPVAIIAGIVAAAAALLGKIFANSKAKSYEAERGQYDIVNAQLRFENMELDKKYDETFSAIKALREGISSLNGVPVESSGLGLCLWNCKDQKQKLQSAKDEYETLKKAQTDKTNLMIDLLNEYNKLMREAVNLQSNKSTKDWLVWILVGTAVLGGGYYLYSKAK